jgi:molybdopterin synthase catalytic subunit/molybdopterin converting factor small subunit
MSGILSTMRVQVLFFGQLKDLTGRSSESLPLGDRATLHDVLAHYSQKYPSIDKLAPSLALSLNQAYATRDAALHDGDEVALLPPVSGGSGRASIVRAKIDPHQIVPPMERPEDGAIAMFDGIVRNNSRGRKTLYLEYEAYEEMALKQMEELIVEALKKFPARDARIVHRLGRIEIGESSVFIAVASAHRAAAFDACRWLIDTLKKTVPIWKKEYFEGGAVWADGEPFPTEITAGKILTTGREAASK